MLLQDHLVKEHFVNSFLNCLLSIFVLKLISYTCPTEYEYKQVLLLVNRMRLLVN